MKARAYDVVVLTDDRYVGPKDRNEYIDNVLLEDRLVVDALNDQGIKTVKKSWSDPDFDWKSTSYILFRTTWDYAERFTEFSDWLLKVSTQTRMINAYSLLIWNLDKHYLQDLQMQGVNVVETYFIEFGDQRSLKELHETLGWSETVLKPVISAAAKDTFKLNSENLAAHESHFSELIKNESMMLQPFQHDVLERGELSLMVIGGAYTHAVLKKAKQGDFRVQDDFGGTVHGYEPTDEEIELAIAAVKACDPEPFYARIDIINDNNGHPAVSEIELVEPELWFRRNQEAAVKLAEKVKTSLF